MPKLSYPPCLFTSRDRMWQVRPPYLFTYDVTRSLPRRHVCLYHVTVTSPKVGGAGKEDGLLFADFANNMTR